MKREAIILALVFGFLVIAMIGGASAIQYIEISGTDYNLHTYGSHSNGCISGDYCQAYIELLNPGVMSGNTFLEEPGSIGFIGNGKPIDINKLKIDNLFLPNSPKSGDRGDIDQTFTNFYIYYKNGTLEMQGISLEGYWVYTTDKYNNIGSLMYEINSMILDDKGQIYNGKIRIIIRDYNSSYINNPYMVFSTDLFLLNDNSQQNQRISALESWKQIISDTITSILNTLTGHNTRISKLENSTSNGTTIINNTTIIMNNGTDPYLKYLGSSDRKNMVCGFAEDNHLTNVIDLGWNCTVTYRQTSRGETSSCRCKAIK